MPVRHRTNEEATVRFEGTGQEFPAHITNMSLGGASFRLPEMPMVKEPVTLEMQYGGERVSIAAIVRWVEPCPNGWKAGCRFDQRLQTSTLGRPDRSCCVLPVTYRVQGNPEKLHGVLRDFSSGGVGLETTAEIRPNDCVLIECSEGHSFAGKVSWTRVEDHGTIAGCCFWPATQRAAFSRLAETHGIVLPAATNPSLEVEVPQSGVRAACAFVIGWIVMRLTGIWPT